MKLFIKKFIVGYEGAKPMTKKLCFKGLPKHLYKEAREDVIENEDE